LTVYLPDVNVIVASLRSDHPHHQAALAFLRESRESASTFAVPVDVMASALRVLTLDVWLEPETSESAGRLISDWLTAAQAEVVAHPPMTWTVMAEFARTLSLTSRSVPDALLAASAIASRSTLATFDRGFSGYPGLRAELLNAPR